jgi:hypothetical protein
MFLHELWIDVKEKPIPNLDLEDVRECLALIKCQYIQTVSPIDLGEGVVLVGEYDPDIEDVTHWMPLSALFRKETV